MSTALSAPTCRRLEKAARAAVRQAYAPYSKFRVGAAVLAVVAATDDSATKAASKPTAATNTGSRSRQALLVRGTG